MNVSIIIVNYNTKELTRNCINSIYLHTEGISFEVILVDNGSIDGSKEWFENDHRIKYIYNKENIGFGKANNLGYAEAKGDYILLLNSDTLLQNNAVYKMFHFMQHTQGDVGCVGCELKDVEGGQMFSYGSFPSIKYFFGKILEGYLIKIPLLLGRSSSCGSNQSKVDFLSGADLFVRRKVKEEYGLFDPDFFLYFEEVEMQHRYAEHGYESNIIDSPQIIHLEGASNKKKQGGRRSLRVPQIELQSRYIYCEKVMPKWDCIIIAYMHLLLIPKILLFNSSWADKLTMIKTIIKHL